MSNHKELEYNLEELERFKLKEDEKIYQLYHQKGYKSYERRKKSARDTYRRVLQKGHDYFELNKYGYGALDLVGVLDNIFNGHEFGKYYLCITDLTNESTFMVEYVDRDKNIYRLNPKYKQSFVYDDYNLKKLGYDVGEDRHRYLEGYTNCFFYKKAYCRSVINLTFDSMEDLSLMFGDIYGYNLSEFVNLEFSNNKIAKTGSLNVEDDVIIKEHMLMYIIKELDVNNTVKKDAEIINKSITYLEERYFLTKDEVKVLKDELGKLNLTDVMGLKKKKSRKPYVLFDSDYYSNKESKYIYRKGLYNLDNIDLNEVKKEYNMGYILKEDEND